MSIIYIGCPKSTALVARMGERKQIAKCSLRSFVEQIFSFKLSSCSAHLLKNSPTYRVSSKICLLKPYENLTWFFKRKKNQRWKLNFYNILTLQRLTKIGQCLHNRLFFIRWLKITFFFFKIFASIFDTKAQSFLPFHQHCLLKFLFWYCFEDILYCVLDLFDRVEVCTL